MFASPDRRRRFLLHLLVAAVLLAGLVVLVRPYLDVITEPDRARQFIRQYGRWAPLALIVLQALQVVLAPVPSQVLAVVGGYLFGVWWGTLYNMIGITIGSTIAFWLSRRFGRVYVERMVHPDILGRFDAIDTDYVRVTLFVGFLVPGLPDDTLCFAGGLTDVPLWQLVLIAIIGRTPGFFLANMVGEFIGADRPLAAVALAAVILGLSILGYLNRTRLYRLFR